MKARFLLVLVAVSIGIFGCSENLVNSTQETLEKEKEAQAQVRIVIPAPPSAQQSARGKASAGGMWVSIWIKSDSLTKSNQLLLSPNEEGYFEAYITLKAPASYEILVEATVNGTIYSSGWTQLDVGPGQGYVLSVTLRKKSRNATVWIQATYDSIDYNNVAIFFVHPNPIRGEAIFKQDSSYYSIACRTIGLNILHNPVVIFKIFSENGRLTGVLHPVFLFSHSPESGFGYEWNLTVFDTTSNSYIELPVGAYTIRAELYENPSEWKIYENSIALPIHIEPVATTETKFVIAELTYG